MGENKVKPGRVDGHNSECRSGGVSISKELRHELAGIFGAHIDKGATKDKRVGQLTIEKRKEVILGAFSDLYFLRFKIKMVKSLGQKHIQALVTLWETGGQSPATIQNKLSILRTFCGWIGKPGMVKASEKYVGNPDSVKRTMVAQEDKSWEAKGIDVLEKLAEIEKEYKKVSDVLLLCYAFGLRIREAVLLHLFKAEDSGSLKIVQGTKGGRVRSVPMEHEWQHAVLEGLKKKVNQKTGRFVTPKGGEAYIQRIYYIMRKHGLTLAELGVSAHGLRHQYFHERFFELLGIQPPVKGGDLSEVDKAEFEVATGKLMERGGHSRTSIGVSYYGSRRIFDGNGQDESEPDAVSSTEDEATKKKE